MKKIFLLLMFPLVSLAQTPDATVKTNTDNWVRSAPLITGSNEATLFDQITNSKISRLEGYSSSGTNTYTATVPWLSGYGSNFWVAINFGNANTATSTLNLTGSSGSPLGAKSIYKNSNGTLVALTGGELFGAVWLYYNGTSFQVSSGSVPSVFTSSLNGLAPASGGGTSNFLRADGTWATPSGSYSNSASTNEIPVTVFGGNLGSSNIYQGGSTGGIDLGYSGLGGSYRKISSVGSATNLDLVLQPQGTASGTSNVIANGSNFSYYGDNGTSGGGNTSYAGCKGCISFRSGTPPSGTWISQNDALLYYSGGSLFGLALYHRDGSIQQSSLPVQSSGTSGNVLMSGNGSSTFASWGSLPGSSGSSGAIQFSDGSGGFTSDLGLSYNTSNKYLYLLNKNASAGNAVIQQLRISGQTTLTPGTGIGSRMEFEAQTAAGPVLKVGNAIESVSTDITSLSEDFDLVIKNMAAGSTAAESFRVSSVGDVSIGAGLGGTIRNVSAKGTGSNVSLYMNSQGSSGDIQFYNNSTKYLHLTNDGRLYGTALHNNSGSVTGTTNHYIASGSYTPTITSVTNVSSTSAHGCQWIRVGNVVTVSGSVDITPTANSSDTEIGISLPIASNIVNDFNCTGTGASKLTFQVGAIWGDATNDRAELEYTSQTTSQRSMYFTFQYLVN